MALASTHHELDEIRPGVFRHVQHMRPIGFWNGALVRDPFVLGNSGDPNLTVGCDGISQFRLRARLSGNAPVLHFAKGQSHVRLTPLDTNNVDGLAVGLNGFRYPNAWNNADLELRYGGHRIQKNILLGAGHPQRFQFRIDSHAGLNLDTLATPDFRILQPALENPATGETIALTWLVSVQGGKTVLTVSLPPGDWAGWVLDPTLTLQPDATDGIDTRICGTNLSTVNFGVNVFLGIGESNLADNYAYRTLIKFNLTSLPDSAIIASATLGLYYNAQEASANCLARVYRQKRAWLEGTRNLAIDNPATGATWNRYDTTNNWQTAGGFGANDCEQVGIGSLTLATTDTLNAFDNWALTPTTKSALDLGNGWMLKGDTELNNAYFFASSDNTTPANRPTLTVEYTLPLSGHNVFAGVGQGVLAGVA